MASLISTLIFLNLRSQRVSEKRWTFFLRKEIYLFLYVLFQAFLRFLPFYFLGLFTKNQKSIAYFLAIQDLSVYCDQTLQLFSSCLMISMHTFMIFFLKIILKIILYASFQDQDDLYEVLGGVRPKRPFLDCEGYILNVHVVIQSKGIQILHFRKKNLGMRKYKSFCLLLKLSFQMREMTESMEQLFQNKQLTFRGSQELVRIILVEPRSNVIQNIQWKECNNDAIFSQIPSKYCIFYLIGCVVKEQVNYKLQNFLQNKQSDERSSRQDIPRCFDCLSQAQITLLLYCRPFICIYMQVQMGEI